VREKESRGAEGKVGMGREGWEGRGRAIPPNKNPGYGLEDQRSTTVPRKWKVMALYGSNTSRAKNVRE